MLINTLLNTINDEIPFHTAESWDNVGLLIGDKQSEVIGILTALDCTVEVIDEAIAHDINTIICHHPLIFSGIKSIHNEGYGQVIQHLIKHDMNLIALHTNLDAHPQGVSAMIADALKLTDIKILLPEEQKLIKLQIFVPNEHAMTLKSKLAEAGAGRIGDYDHCFYSTQGTGEFRALDNANPYVGKVGEVHYEPEVKVECVFEPHLKSAILEVIEQHHPYETPAFDILTFTVPGVYGTGVQAKLSEPMMLSEFAQIAKTNLSLDVIKMIGEDKQIETVGIIGGAGMSFLHDVKRTGVDVFLTGDIKYHEAHDVLMAGMKALDITHYSEYVMKEGLKQLLETFNLDTPIIASQVNTNPFKAI